MKRTIGVGLAALMATTALSAALVAPAHASEKGRKNTAAVLGGIAVYELLKGKTGAGLVAGAGAAVAYKRYKDARDDDRRYDRYDRNDGRYRRSSDRDDPYYSDRYDRRDNPYQTGYGKGDNPYQGRYDGRDNPYQGRYDSRDNPYQGRYDTRDNPYQGRYDSRDNPYQGRYDDRGYYRTNDRSPYQYSDRREECDRYGQRGSDRSPYYQRTYDRR